MNRSGNNMNDERWKDKKKNNGNGMDDLGEWVQDLVQDAVDSMDFTGLSQKICDAVNFAREEMTEQVRKQMHTRERQREERQGKRDKRVQKPVAERQPRDRGWMRKIPGCYRGPVSAIIGGGGLVIFGALCLGVGLAGIGFSTIHGVFSTATIILESVFIPLTILSGVLLGTGRAAQKRVRRIKEYAHIWGDSGFVMLDELKKSTGYAMKQIKNDIQFLIDRKVIPYARFDEKQTCFIMTKEAGEQYDAAMQAKTEREKEQERRRQQEMSMTQEEQKMHHLQQTGGRYLKEIRERGQRIQTPEMSEKLRRLELLLSRIFVCIGQYPENISQADRLLEYYLPSVMKLVRVYEDMEKQPIQSVNIVKTRMEIAESLDTVNQALEAMYDDMFQDVAMDISSDIKVLETMLAKDGWGVQEMHSQEREGSSSIWE